MKALFNTVLLESQITTCKIRAGQEVLHCSTQLMGAHGLNLSGKHSWLLQNQPLSLPLQRAASHFLRAVSQGGAFLCHPPSLQLSSAPSLWAWQVSAGNKTSKNSTDWKLFSFLTHVRNILQGSLLQWSHPRNIPSLGSKNLTLFWAEKL